MQGFYTKENAYFDTSTASIEAIRKCLKAVGAKRIIFGSDVSGTSESFHNFPKIEPERSIN